MLNLKAIQNLNQKDYDNVSINNVTLLEKQVYIHARFHLFQEMLVFGQTDK